MASLSELLTNFKTLMHTYFPYTSEVNDSLDGKVDKENGKGLSSNDYTTTEKNKLAGLSNYSHPTAKQCSYSYSHPTSKQCNATIPTVDSSLSTTSTNAIQNKVIYNKVLSARNTKLTVDNYNVAIDGTCVITCTLTDIFGTAVANENVTVTCDKGYFTKYNNTDISGTTTKSKTGTTNSSGQFTLTHKASEWGLTTFSANNATSQVKVKGYKLVQTITSGNVSIKLYSDGTFVYASISGSVTPTSTTHILGTIDSSYRPLTSIGFNYHHNTNVFYIVSIRTNGNVVLSNAPLNNNINLDNSTTYLLNTTLY